MIIQETPTLNLQFDKARNDSDMLSLLKSQGGTFTRGAEVVGSGDSVASYVDALGILRYAKLGHPRPYFEDGVNQGLLIEEQRTNLLKHSENFSNAVWSKSNGGTGVLPIVTPNDGIAPNGELSADRIDFDRGAGNTTSDIASISQFFSVTPQNYAGYVYFKAATPSDVGKQLSFRQVGVSGYTSITLSSEWQRLGSVELSTITGTRSIEITCRGGVGVTGSNQVSAHIWGAQQEAGSFETTYIPTKSTFVSRASTATYFDQNGVLQTADVNEARDNNHVYINDKWVKTGLLIEEQRTNLLLHSENFDNAVWVNLKAGDGANPVVTLNAGISPDGLNNATRILFTRSTANSSNFSLRRQDKILSGTHTGSIYVKSASGSNETFDFRIAEVEKSFTATNEWQRITDTEASSLHLQIGIRLATSGLSADILVWGAQLEAGSFPTSYIPTAGTTVTRSADITTSASVTRGKDLPIDSDVLNIINNSEGSFLIDCDFTTNNGVSDSGVLELSDGTSNNRIAFIKNRDRKVQLYIRTSGVDQVVIFPATVYTGQVKLAFRYGTNNVKAHVNGVSIGEDLTVSLGNYTKINFGTIFNNNNVFNDTIKRVIYYPKALPDADLQLLTRI